MYSNETAAMSSYALRLSLGSSSEARTSSSAWLRYGHGDLLWVRRACTPFDDVVSDSVHYPATGECGISETLMPTR